MDKDLVDQVIDVAQRVVASGAISANGHGNVSLRVPGAEEMYFTAGPSLRNHAPSSVVRVGLDGTLLEGDLPPIQGAVVAMHTAMYADHPDVGCVLHTHSPYATAYAVAHRPIGCWVEALAMFGLPTGVPVAGYGPRGSDQAVANIRASITPAPKIACTPSRHVRSRVLARGSTAAFALSSGTAYPAFGGSPSDLYCHRPIVRPIEEPISSRGRWRGARGFRSWSDGFAQCGHPRQRSPCLAP